MSVPSLRRLNGLFGLMLAFVLACGRRATDGGGETEAPSSASSGGSSSSGGATTGGTDTSDTGTTAPGCDPIQLSDIAQGIGGFALDGEAETDFSGFSVSEVGDINGDGLTDIVVGAYGADPTGPYSGRSYVVYGKADTTTTLLADVALGTGGFALDGEIEGDASGAAVSGRGDVNGDGLPDVIVGAPSADASGAYRSGRTYVVFGQPDSDTVLLAAVAQGIGGFVLHGEAEEDYSGASVSGVGDINGDGLADVVVAAPWADPQGLQSGRSYVVFGKADADPVQLADVALGIGGFSVDAEGAHDESGWSVSAAGDVNGDDLADLVVGAPLADPNGTFAGRTYVVFGKTGSDNVQLADVEQGIGGFALDGESESDVSGRSVSAAGDINGDSLADVVVGAPGAPSGSYRGRIYVVFGKQGTDSVSLAEVAEGIGGFALDGEQEGDGYAMSVSVASDINGDGLDDVLVGAPSADPNGSESGRIYVVFGKASTDRVSLADVARGHGGFAVDGEAEEDMAGRSVAGAGDVNGDGVPDILVGAPDADPNGEASGRTYVVFGGDLCAGE